ncbi:F-box/kelch-repeat protein At3g23880-like isoform X2 [Silene latifolia]
MSDVNPFLSEDIWFEIFKKLPVKTLGKCRCVCKSWHSLVVSPSFMAAHHKHYTQNNANSLILCKEVVKRSETEELEQCIFFRNLDQLKQGNRLHTSVWPFVVCQPFQSSFHFVGCVNGLLCLSDTDHLGHRDRILIWNPLIQKSIKLRNSSCKGSHSLVGFGYDYQRNDHRVVKISYSAAKTPFVEVYSVQKRKWRTICADYLVDNLITEISASPCFCNGLIYWPIRSRRMEISNNPIVECLLLYNVAEERFSKMELPEEIVKCSRYGDFGIFEYSGMLSVSHCQYMFLEMSTTTHCQIWVKQDCNVESSWCKIVNDCVSYGYHHEGSLHYLGANKELVGFNKENTGQLVSYNPKTGHITELGFNVSQSPKFCAYSESLALLDQKTDNRTAAELKRSVNRRPRGNF